MIQSKSLGIYIINIRAAFLALAFIFFIYPSVTAETNPAPIISIDETKHVFPAIFEGEDLLHTFNVKNLGTADLVIKKVTHS